MVKQYVLRTGDGYEYPISGVTHIGRDESNGIPIDDAAISRHHASVWLEGGKLLIADNQSANGVFVNNKQIAHDKPRALRSGDVVRLGQTELVVALSDQTATGTVILEPGDGRPRSRMPLVACSVLGIVGVLLLVAVPVIGFTLLNWDLVDVNPPTGSSPLAQLTTPGAFTLTPPPTVVNVNVSVVRQATPQVVPPGRVAASSQDLARAIAELNQAELAFIHEAASVTGHISGKFLFSPAANRPRALDDHLAQVAAEAMEVALLANALSLTLVSQAGGSETAEQLASQYTSIAQLTAALVLEAHNLRAQLSSGSVTPLEASGVIAEYGGRLWTTQQADPQTQANPFAALAAGLPAHQSIAGADINSLLNLGRDVQPVWMAVAGETVTKTISVPASGRPPADTGDPAVLASLTTARGQRDDPKAARQVATEILAISAGSPDSGGNGDQDREVTAQFYSGVAVAAPEAQNTAATPPRALPVFPGGSASALTQPDPAANPLATLLGIDGNGGASVAGQVSVTETQPIVSLTISNVTITKVDKKPKDEFSTFEAEVLYEFDVQWAANLANPKFELDCISGNHFSITSSSGSQHIRAKGLLILFPGAEDAYCYASRNGNTIGSASTRFLVGDAAEATKRADQVETDSAALNLTLTADVVGTQSVAQTSAAATRGSEATANAVGTEVAASRTAEFPLTGTAFAIKQTQFFGQTATESVRQFLLEGTATHAALLTEQAATANATEAPYSFGHAGNVFGTSTKPLISGHRYRICLAGLVHLVNPDASVGPHEIMHINGIKVPAGGCLEITGTGAVANITCGSGEPAENPGGYTVTVTDLGP